MKLLRTSALPLLVIGAHLLAVGCGDGLPDQFEIVDDRVIGATIEVLERPGSATPGPGETARFELISRSPTPVERTYAIFVCPKFPFDTVGAFCVGGSPEDPFADSAVFARNVVETPTMETPFLEVTIPPTIPEELTEALIFGRTCVGQIACDGTECTCTDGGEPGRTTQFVHTAKLTSEIAENKNPVFVQTLFGLDMVAWGDPPETGCEGLPIVQATDPNPPEDVEIEQILLYADFTPESLEEYLKPAPPMFMAGVDEPLPPGPPTEEVEEVLVSLSATMGGSDRDERVIDEMGRAELKYLPPTSDEITEQTRIDLFFVARDDRGGSAVIDRAICVTP